VFKIGDFSRLTLVTVKTLRYYDEIGILKPVNVDRFTGYRYYSADQLPRLHYIIALKDMGLSLDEVAALLKDNLTPAQIRDIFILKKAELQQRVAEEQTRLDRVEKLLMRIEKEGSMPDYQITLKKLEPVLVASVREVLPTYSACGKLFGEVYQYIAMQGAKPVGPPALLMHDPEYKEKDVDIEVAAPVSKSIKGSDRVEVYELPGAEHAASTVHNGPYQTIGEAYNAILTWCQAHNYQPLTPCREIYLTDPSTEKDPNNYVTEIQFPVKKA
jgi:effector-binding domain-containing protein